MRVTQEALATTSMTPVTDPENYINELMRLCNLVTEMKEPFTDRRLSDIVRQGLTENNWDVKLMTWKDPDFDLTKIQCTTSRLPGRVVAAQDREDCWSWHGHDIRIVRSQFCYLQHLQQLP